MGRQGNGATSNLHNNHHGLSIFQTSCWGQHVLTISLLRSALAVFLAASEPALYLSEKLKKFYCQDCMHMHYQLNRWDLEDKHLSGFGKMTASKWMTCIPSPLRNSSCSHLRLLHIINLSAAFVSLFRLVTATAMYLVETTKTRSSIWRLSLTWTDLI